MRGATVTAPTIRSLSRRRSLRRFEPVVCLVRRHAARESCNTDAPGRKVDPEFVAKRTGPYEESRRFVVAAQARMDRTVGTELAEPPNAVRGAGLLEQRDQLVTEPRRREVADEAHLDTAAKQARRVHLEAKPVSGLVADATEDARRVVDEREVVEHAEHASVEIGTATVRIGEPAEVVGPQRRGHGVDGEVASEQVLAERRTLDGRKRPGCVVELGARRHDVDPLVVAVLHDRRPEPLVRRRAAFESLRERVRKGDRVSLDGDVHVEALLAEEDVANRAADEVDALGPPAEPCHCTDDPVQPRVGLELLRNALIRLRGSRRDALQRAQQVGTAHNADELVVADNRDATVLGGGRERPELRERRILSRADDVTAHDPAHRRVREVVTDCLVQVLSAHSAHEPVAVRDEHAALPVSLAERHRVADRCVLLDAAGRRRHHVSRKGRISARCTQGVEDPRTSVREALARDRGSSPRMTSASESDGDRRGIDSVGPAPHDGEHTLVHLDEENECANVGEIEDLVREIRHAVDVVGPAHGCEEHILPVRVDRLQGVEQMLEQASLGRCQRCVQVLAHEVLSCAVAETPRQRVHVALRRRGVRQRARVLVDTERENGRLEPRRRELALGDDADEGRRQRAVRRDDCVLLRDPVGERIVTVMVEEHLLDAGVERDGLELAQPRGARRLDDDQAADRRELEAAHLGNGAQLLGMQAVEVPDVPIQRRNRDDGLRIQKTGGEHRSECVEVGVSVRRDDLLGSHGLILPRCGLDGRGEAYPIPDLADERVEPLVFLDAAVGMPTGTLVEPSTPRVVLEHPQDCTGEPLVAKPQERLRHESPANAEIPRVGTHVDGIQLAELRAVRLEGGAELCEANDLGVPLGHQRMHSIRGCLDPILPPGDPGLDGHRGERRRREDMRVGRPPAPTADFEDRARIGGDGVAHDRTGRAVRRVPRPRSRRARRSEGLRSERSSEPVDGRRRALHRRRSSPRSRRDPSGTPSS